MCMSSESSKKEIKLRPEAPPYVPLGRNIVQVTKEPQCSRYSRRSIRRDLFPNSPRPILGTKIPFPRPILGRSESPQDDEEEDFIGREFRSITRKMQKLKLKDECSKTARKTMKSN